MNRLKIVKDVDFGVYLDGGEGEEILLPNRYVPAEAKVGDELDVFLYLDQEERLIATTEEPLAQVGEFACLEVAWVNQYGAFLNWGLMKDLFCPFREQKRKMEIGDSYVVHVHIDEDSYRIMASAKVEKFLLNAGGASESGTRPPYATGDKVNILVWQRTDLGFKVIVDNRYAGLIYSDQIFRPIHVGDKMEAYIYNVREDGKIDLTLQPTGRQQTLDFSATLLKYMQYNGGRCRLHDKSDAEEIYETFHVSKKVFKRAVGDLYKQRLITITPQGLLLNE